MNRKDKVLIATLLVLITLSVSVKNGNEWLSKRLSADKQGPFASVVSDAGYEMEEKR